MSDTPKVDLVLSDLEKEILKPEPFVLVLSKNRRVTFKDPFGFRLSERNEVLDLYERAQRGEANDLDFLKRILSPEDFKKYEAEDLPIRTHEALVTRVMAHFEGPRGTVGEGNASGA